MFIKQIGILGVAENTPNNKVNKSKTFSSVTKTKTTKFFRYH